MDETDGKRSVNGMFSVSTKQKITGSLSLNGEDTVLHLWGDKIEDTDTLDGATITGTLENQKKVSLIDCVLTRQERFFDNGSAFHHYKLFPHYVVIGAGYHLPSEKTVSVVSFVIDDAMTLFHDRSAFGLLKVPPDRLNDIAMMKPFEKVQFEEDSPTLAYWTGKTEIFAADTAIGRISACHQPSFQVGGSSGACISNRIVASIEFCDAMNVEDADFEIRKVLRFFHAVLGRPQNLVELHIVEDDAFYRESDLHLNLYPKHLRSSNILEPHVGDILVDAATDRESFSKLLCAWIVKEKEWYIARSRFASGWARGGKYDGDRIVGAANMFDLLPDDAVPPNTRLKGSLETAVQQSRQLFKKLARGQERESMLNHLGKLKKPSLKEKIRHRSKVISDRIGDSIPCIDEVTDAAVDLRNVYVHGSATSAEGRNKLQDSISFLTDTLEFVFCASDLVESGWNIESWHKKPKGIGHPFAHYLRAYSEELARFRG